MTGEILLIFAAMLLIAVLAEPVATKLHLPFSALLVLLGFVGSEIVTGLGYDTGLRWDNFSHLILQILVPILVFEAAFNMNAKVLLKDIVPILFLAIPAMLIAVLLTGAVIFFGIGYPQSFPWLAALLAGTILATTDPAAVVAISKCLGVPERLTALLEGESLFNDANAIVLYFLFLGMLLAPNETLSISGAVLNFFYHFFGGLAIGLLCAALLWPLYRRIDKQLYRGIFSLIAAITSFYLADNLHTSGIVAVLSAGLLLGECHRRHNGQTFIRELWQLNAYIVSALIFLLAGATVTWLMFASNYLAMLIGIIAVVCARALIVYSLVPLLTLLPGTKPLPYSHKHIVMWGGQRGAVTLALALALPIELPGEIWFTIQSIAYGVVIFALFVQAPSMPPIIRKALRQT